MSGFVDGPSEFHASFHSEAVRNAIFTNIGYLPVYLFFACIVRNRRLYHTYKSTISFSVIYQFFFTVPYAILYTWIAIFAGNGYPTSVLWCTIIRMGISFLNFTAYDALTAIGFARLLSIAFDIKTGFKTAAIVCLISKVPPILLFTLLFTSGRSQENSVCGPIYFYYRIDDYMLYLLYTFIVPLLNALLNALTALLLLRQRTSRVSVHSSSAHVDEIFVAVGLLVQSIVPALTMSSKGWRSIGEIYGVKFPDWLKQTIDISGLLTTGINVGASMLCIRAFREEIRKLLIDPFCGRSTIQETSVISRAMTT